MTIRNSILIFVCVLVYASLSQAQQKGHVDAGVIPDSGVTYSDSTPMSTSPVASEPPADPDPIPSPPQTGGAVDPTSQDDQWHLSVSPYLWFPWVHGSLGAFGRDIGYSVTPSDLLSHARFGLLGAVEARRNKIVTTGDLLYLRLGASNAIPFPPALQATSANFTANLFILTPKVGLRLVNLEKIKADFLTGIRYWYFGESVNFTPSLLGLNFSKSQNWVDPLVGGRIEMAVARKTVFTVAGDVGGWGTGSQIEYQVGRTSRLQAQTESGSAGRVPLSLF
jgi:hypothetical protein